MAAVQEGIAEIDQGKGVPIEAVEQTLETPLENGDSHQPTIIIRTKRGLTISGTRITLYDVMDYVTAHYPPQFIQGLFNLTDEQITVALAYIEANRQQVEEEYQAVLNSAEENQQYWEEQNRELIEGFAHRSPKPGTEAIWTKLNAQKVKHNAEAQSH